MENDVIKRLSDWLAEDEDRRVEIGTSYTLGPKMLRCRIGLDEKPGVAAYDEHCDLSSVITQALTIWERDHGKA